MGTEEEDDMLIDMNGISPAFKDKTIQIVEALDGPYKFKLSNEKGRTPQTLVFEVDSDDDPTAVAKYLKGAIKKSELGNIMYFQAVPHGQFML